MRFGWILHGSTEKPLLFSFLRKALRKGAASFYYSFDCFIEKIVHNCEGCAGDHHNQRNDIGGGQGFLQQQEGDECPDEGRDRVIGTGSRRAECFLRSDVGEYAQSVGDKSSSTGGIFPGSGGVSLRKYATNSAPVPEPKPLIVTIW